MSTLLEPETTPRPAPPSPAPPPYAPQSEPLPQDAVASDDYLGEAGGHTILSWLLTVDHKRIGMLYLVTTTIAFALGAIAAAMVRLNLVVPGGLLDVAYYNRMFTAHGAIMVFFFLVPVVPGVLGNFLIPLAVGARDMAFPKLNLLSWYLYMAGMGIAMWTMVVGGLDTGWTLYTPYSSQSSTTNLIPVVTGVFISGFSSILTGLNIVVTVHRMRAPGMTWFRLPLFVWAMYATSLIQLLATPVLAVTLVMLGLERAFQVGIFDPKLEGDPLLFQHMFWFYSHPAVYIMILPGMGVISEVITCFSRKNIFGYSFVALSSMGIALAGFIVWGHHMFVSGQGYYSALMFSLLSFTVAVPSAVKVFNWTATLYKGSLSFEAPMIYTIGFIVLFTVGGLTGLFLATLGTDIHMHDTYFVIAHFHFVMVGGMVLAYLAGLHFWWPKMTGRMYSDWWSRIGASILAVGFFLTFMPQFVLGYLGMPRRYHAYLVTDTDLQLTLHVLNVLSSAGATILGLGYLFPVCYLTHSLFYGKKAGPNPYHATGLEWMTTSPPPVHNFHHTPVVRQGPYEYALSHEEIVSLAGEGNGSNHH